MATTDHRRFIPTIPESQFDRIALALLEILPYDVTLTAIFGGADCLPGTALVEPVECCWDFERGPTKIIERLSLGTANAWRVDWICQPEADPPDRGGLEYASTDDARVSPATRPWVVQHADVALTVFPMGINALLRGEVGTTVIPAGTPVGRISYSPNGMKRFDVGNRTYAVAHAFQGFELLFECINEASTKQLTVPEYFLGDAPEKRMCLFLKHFGFEVIDNGEFGASVFAPVERVRANLHLNRRRGERLLARANRESARRR